MGTDPVQAPPDILPDHREVRMTGATGSTPPDTARSEPLTPAPSENFKPGKGRAPHPDLAPLGAGKGKAPRHRPAPKGAGKGKRGLLSPPFMLICVHDLPFAPPCDRWDIGPTGALHAPRTPPVFRPQHSANRISAGFKLFLGDLPHWVTADMVRQWFCVHPALQDVDVTDISVSAGAATGALKAIVTMRTPEDAVAAHDFFWAVWTPSRLEGSGWRWLTVHGFMDGPGGGKR
ncbi:MAG: RNA-binding protein [bacterium]|nr:RNA-binding protein [bacterium]